MYPNVKTTNESRARELHTLIRVEDLWPPSLQSALQGTTTKVALECHRDFPGQDVAREPINYRHQLGEPMQQVDVSNVG